MVLTTLSSLTSFTFICVAFASGEVSRPPHPLLPVAPTPLTPPALAADTPQTAKDGAKLANETAVRAYEQ